MLSICIPIYNYDVTALVQELKKQVEEHSLECEIILADDASDDVELKRKNTSIVSMCGAKFIALEKNIGRSAIRNLLALNASGDSILFLDCDTVPVRNDFLQKYYHVMNDDVVVGGIAYRDALDDQSAMLRWTYGHKRESKTADERLKMPYASFMTGNFMIKKTVFKQFTFDENITQYGHEDTLFGIQLKQHRIEIK
ncbi:MAG TPA: glycosyltransferase, partial [Prolixibacteraceae bacterium]|nr:glycosyltransferase [Prolixibacteraceae bacterium]